MGKEGLYKLRNGTIVLHTHNTYEYDSLYVRAEAARSGGEFEMDGIRYEVADSQENPLGRITYGVWDHTGHDLGYRVHNDISLPQATDFILSPKAIENSYMGVVPLLEISPE